MSATTESRRRKAHLAAQIAIIVLLPLLILVPLCRFVVPKHKAIQSRQEGYLLFDAETIFQSLARGSTDIFITSRQIAAEPWSTPATAAQEWEQDDFLAVAKASHRFVWDGSWAGMQVTKLLFRLDCDDARTGPQVAEVEFSGLVRQGGAKNGSHRLVLIDARHQVVTWREQTFPADQLVLLPIDPGSILLPAQDALQIGEANGGRTAREAAADHCTIFILLDPISVYEGWQVSYLSAGATLLKTYISAESGEIQAPKQPQD